MATLPILPENETHLRMNFTRGDAFRLLFDVNSDTYTIRFNGQNLPPGIRNVGNGNEISGTWEQNGRFNSELHVTINDITVVVNVEIVVTDTPTIDGTISTQRFFSQKGDFNNAIKDYTTVIELKPNNPYAYYSRGEAWLHLQEWEKAKSDLTISVGKEIDIKTLFHRTYGSVEDFEQETDIQLSEDIAEMLTQ